MTDGRLFKIGKSINVKSRLNQIKTGNPFIKLIDYSNNISEELLHDCFKNERIKGEWFELNQNDVDFILLKFNNNKKYTISDFNLRNELYDKDNNAKNKEILELKNELYYLKQKFNMVETSNNLNKIMYNNIKDNYIKLLKKALNIDIIIDSSFFNEKFDFNFFERISML
jgi:hypothetical protein